MAHHTGRTPSYTTAKTRAAIPIAEAAGQTPDGNTVEAMLMEWLGASGSLDVQSLGTEVARVIERDRAQRLRGLIAALPESVKIGIAAHVDRLGWGLTGLLAESHAQLGDVARSLVVAREHDLASQRRVNEALEADVAEKDARIADLEQTVANLRVEAADAHRQIAFRDGEMATPRARLKLSAEVRDALLSRLGNVQSPAKIRPRRREL